MANKDLVFDIGMYDGADTEYYLSKGFRVVAIEANPIFIDKARVNFSNFIENGRLFLENLAIGESEGSIQLYISKQDLGASSTNYERFVNRNINSSIEVRCVPFSEILSSYGVPYYLKCDIEGNDRYCILELSNDYLPEYVSFEMGDDAIELMEHLFHLGYSHFKIINQIAFREISRVRYLQFPDRLLRYLKRRFDMPGANYVSRDGFRFRSGHSSGPMMEATDGRWKPYGKTKAL